MNKTQESCLVFSDYPIKLMGYARFFKSLGQNDAVFLDNYPSSDAENFVDARVVVFDMNILPEQEEAHRASLMRLFKNAHILFMEEDHSDLHYQLAQGRDICRLGKLAEVKVMHACLKDMLLRCHNDQNRTGRQRSKTDKSDTEMA
ncbi:MAG TPA: hypothetical protein VFV57_01035 [Limnobacter sp.]|nr:hypothetical protein [Limnobacter sp.]